MPQINEIDGRRATDENVTLRDLRWFGDLHDIVEKVQRCQTALTTRRLDPIESQLATVLTDTIQSEIEELARSIAASQSSESPDRSRLLPRIASKVEDLCALCDQLTAIIFRKGREAMATPLA